MSINQGTINLTILKTPNSTQNKHFCKQPPITMLQQKQSNQNVVTRKNYKNSIFGIIELFSQHTSKMFSGKQLQFCSTNLNHTFKSYLAQLSPHKGWKIHRMLHRSLLLVHTLFPVKIKRSAVNLVACKTLEKTLKLDFKWYYIK